MRYKRRTRKARWSEDRHVIVATFATIAVVLAVVFGVGYLPQIAAALSIK